MVENADGNAFNSDFCKLSLRWKPGFGLGRKLLALPLFGVFILVSAKVLRVAASKRQENPEHVLNSRRNKGRALTCSQRTRDSAHKDGFAGIQRLRSVHDKITVAQVPGANLNLQRNRHGVLNLLSPHLFRKHQRELLDSQVCP